MANTTLQTCFTLDQAFRSPDRDYRIAGIHHAAQRLQADVQVREFLQALLADGDELVTLYTAVCLAQSGDYTGVQYILEALRSAPVPSRQLRGCLRNCTNFPFVVVLNEVIDLVCLPDLQPIGVRLFLENVLTRSRSWFNQLAKEDRSLKNGLLTLFDQLGRVTGVRWRPGKVCGSGCILRPAFGGQDGEVAYSQGGRRLGFREESVLNLDQVQTGRDVLFVAAQQAQARAELLYVLEV